jgi:threonylcarbamoyladenosine tRNA methylthiotransferase MtaB
MKVYLDTIGCRLNQGEIENYARQFRAAGHQLVPSPGEADVVVINTCTVTAAAASDSRQKIRQAARAGAGEIIATGCWTTLSPESAASLPGVTRIVNNAEKDHLVADYLGVASDSFDLEPVERELIPGARARTRAFIKVQDGCDNRCTFCITTLARGKGRSHLIQEVVADVQAVLRGNNEKSKEVVLTGVHLGSWGHDLQPRQDLTTLVRAILSETDVPRLRLSSLEPWDLDESFFSLWDDPRLCRHIHLPLQSGSASVLRRMARKTTPEDFTALLKAARAAVPDIAVTTDIIAGFPGETDAEFTESLDFVIRSGFAGGHTFTYSARPGTAAASLPNQLPHPVRKERSARMRRVLDESGDKYRRLFIGKDLSVLWESATRLGPEMWDISGLTDNYLRVYTRAPQQVWNRITTARMTGILKDGLWGAVNI